MLHLLTLLFITCTFSSAEALRIGKWCFEGCELTLNYAEFNDTNLAHGSHKARACHSRLKWTSLYLCIDEYCESGGRKEWFAWMNGLCGQIANVSLPPYDIIDAYPPKERIGVKRLSANEGLTFPRIGEVVIPEEGFFERAFMTLDAAYYENDIHLVYGWCMIYFWAIVFTIGVTTRLASSVASIRKQEWQPMSADPDELDSLDFPRNRSKVKISQANAQLKRYITIPATFSNRCSQPLGWCTIPTRIQALTIFTFVLLNVVLCTLDYRVTHGNLYWPDEYIQLWRYVSDRTGVISLVNFPLIWIFGMRNHVLMWLTGWGYGTYNSFHRWVARVSTVQAIVHSAGYTVMVWERGGWKNFQKYLHKHYFWNGEIATIFMCALLAFSVYGLRRSHYEIFLTLHIVLSIVVLLTMYYHVEIFTSGEWNIFIYPCLLVWLFDRLLRVLRILAFNPLFWNSNAIATYDAHSDLVRMDVPFRKNFFNPEPKPGTYYYIYVLSDILYAHQNHPFTLAYVTSGNDDDGDRNNLRSLLRRSSSTESTESDSLLTYSALESTPTPQSLVFLIRPYSGFTRRLATHLSSAQPKPPTRLRVLIEGPYGHPTPLHTYPNILFVVGGTGIAIPLSHLSALLSSSSKVMSLRIIWAVRKHAFLAFILQEFSTLLEDERVVFEAHVTQDEESKDGVLEGDGEGEREIRRRGLRIGAGRPDVRGAVEDAAMEAGQEKLAIVACGPAQMADQARRASVEMLGAGYREVDYFEESFKW